MARIDPIRLTLADATPVLIRSAEPDDAPAMLAYLEDLDPTTDHNVSISGENERTEQAQRTWIGERLDNPGELAMLAFAGDLLVGELDTRCAAKLSRIRHHAMLGVSVRDGWRGRGIGRALIATLIDHAGAHPFLEQIRLGVFADNVGAIRLYEAMGFIREGRRVRAFRRGPGAYADDILMYRDVKDDRGRPIPAQGSANAVTPRAGGDRKTNAV